MSTIRWWDPVGELAQTHRLMDRLIDGVFGPGGTSSPEQQGGGVPTYFMPVDILETEEAYVLQAAVPGFDPEQVEVTFDEGILSIQAVLSPDTVNGRWLRRERPYGHFVRKLQLPTEVLGDKIQADFENGVLTVSVPKARKPQPMKIPVSGKAGKQLTASPKA